MSGKFIDLHVHTNFSDGCDDIPTVVQKAKDNNVGVMSLTEHYNISSYMSAVECANGDIEIIPGIEIGADMSHIAPGKKHICHILGYYVSDEICKLLDKYEEDRAQCVQKTLDLLRKHKVHLTMEQIAEVARNPKSIGRYDIALALSYYNYARTSQEAYGKYLDHKGKSYVKRNKLQPNELVAKITDCDGIPVLAHPKSLHLSLEDERSFIEQLVVNGLKGIEVYNPNNSCEDRERYLEICSFYGLVPTVGSDYHGGNRKPEIKIGQGINGNLCVSDDEIVTKLKRLKR